MTKEELQRLSKYWEYPCLIIDEHGTIVLATGAAKMETGNSEDYFSGIIIKSKYYYSGAYGCSWNKFGCRLYKGEITLKND